MSSKNWSRENLAWLAGIIEGEGYIAEWPPRVNVQMTDKDVVARCAEIAGVGHMTGPRHQGKAHYKTFWRWRVSQGAHTYALLAAILPWLHSRRTAAAHAAMAAFAESKPRGSKKVHGTRARYRAGCKCDLCRAAVYRHNEKYLSRQAA